MPSAASRIDQLRSEIREHSHRYYILDDPVVSDAQYDALVKELQGLEEEHPELVTADSPTQRVGAVVGSLFAPVRHLRPTVLPGQRSVTGGPRDLGTADGAPAGGATERLRVRAQDRRACCRPHLPGWGPRHRGHPRRRGDRRGHHPQLAHHRVGSPPPSWEQAPQPHRGPRRGLHAGERLRGAEPAPGGEGRAPLRQPPQRRRRVGPAKGPPG